MYRAVGCTGRAKATNEMDGVRQGLQCSILYDDFCNQPTMITNQWTNQKRKNKAIQKLNAFIVTQCILGLSKIHRKKHGRNGIFFMCFAIQFVTVMLLIANLPALLVQILRTIAYIVYG